MLGNRQMFANTDIATLARLHTVIPSHHTPGLTFTRMLEFGLSPAETLLLIVFLLLLAYCVLLAVSSCRDSLKSWKPGAKLDYPESGIPDYLWALREQDLEELVEEEQTFLYDFNVVNVDERTLRKAEDILQQGQDGGAYQTKEWATRKTITGEPYYQVYKHFDYWLEFNN